MFQKMLIILLSFVFTCVANADPATEKLEKELANWDAVQGNFKQEVYEGSTEKLVNDTRGKFYLKKPGKLRWEVTKEREKTLIVSDGKQIWHYDPDLEQVTVEQFNPQGTSPLLFLTAKQQNLAQQFTVKEVNNPLCGKGADACFEMKPKSDDAMFQWLRIGFSKESLMGLEFLDQLGQHGWITFTQVQVNKPMSENLFKFSPPKGTDVIRR